MKDKQARATNKRHDLEIDHLQREIEWLRACCKRSTREFEKLQKIAKHYKTHTHGKSEQELC